MSREGIKSGPRDFRGPFFFCLMKKEILGIIVVLFLGCSADKSGEDQSAKMNPLGQIGLETGLELFAILPIDVDRDGLKDILIIDHGKNLLGLFSQEEKHKFEFNRKWAIGGFHPGNLIDVSDATTKIILSAEGDNSIRAITWKAGEGLVVVNNQSELSPRYSQPFSWPGWENSLAVSPYATGLVTIVKNYSSENPEKSIRVMVPLSKAMNSIREAYRITKADIDGDGIDELLFVTTTPQEVITISHPKKDKKPIVKTIFYGNGKLGAPNEARPVDLDGDGDNDLLLADEIMPGNINVLINQGRGDFKEGHPIPFPGGRGITEMRVGKDSDGTRYILAAGYGRISLYRLPKNWHDGDPMEMESIPWREDVASDLSLEDMDNDGVLDGVLASRYGEHNLWIVYGPLWDRFGELNKSNFSLE